MIFWDTSAWVRRYEPDDPMQARAQNLFDNSKRQFGSQLMRIEVLSAAARTRRLRKSGLLPILKAIRDDLETVELVPISDSIEEAERLVIKYRIRAADAIILAGAVLVNRKIVRVPFVTADEEQESAARKEGLKVIRLGI